MRLLLLGFVAGLVMLPGQVRTVTIKAGPANTVPSNVKPGETGAKSGTAVSVPTLGFLEEPGGAGLIPIRGVAAAAAIGDTVPMPEGVSRVYLPPRQHYALAEEGSAQTLAIWHLARSHVANGNPVLDTITGALAHPDLVAFSPRGTSAALYFSGSASLQIVSGLPSRAAIKANISTENLSKLTMLAVSDDGVLVIAKDAAGQLELTSDGQTWRTLPWLYTPIAWSFVSNSHNLAISDSQQKQLFLLQQIDNPIGAPVVLGNGLQPDHLAVTSDGGTMIVLDTAQGTLWNVSLKADEVTPIALAQRADLLVTLRDGHSFLLSSSPLSLIRVPDSVSSGVGVTKSESVIAAGKQE